MINGVLIVNKPKNYTSRDIVNIISKKFNTKKVGHTGTLDPLATGVLVITIGKATKLCDILTSDEKRYIATAILGIKTDTFDIDGNILEERNENISKDKIINTLNKFKTTYNQQVPIYSAVKVNGKKLYQYARENIDIIPPSKEVTIKDINLLDIKYENNKTIIKFDCLVSKGTYIRSLINDIANDLNTIGIMSELIRTKQGDFDINNSYSIEDIENNNFKILEIANVLKYPTINIDEDIAFKIKNGAFIKNIYNKEYILFKNDNIIAIYKDDNGILKPFKMLF